MAQLTPMQLEVLMRGIHPNRVGKDRNGYAHTQGWDIRRYLTRVFGFGGWSEEITELTEVATNSIPNGKTGAGDARFKHTVVYRARVRLTVKDAGGNIVSFWDGAASGAGNNLPNLADAHDMALKTASTQALKRAAMNLGDQFGLSLYNGGSVEPVVGWSAAHPPEGVQKIAETVDAPVQPEQDATQNDDDDQDETESVAQLSDADLYDAAASGHYEVEGPAQQELMRRAGVGRPAAVQDRPQPSEIVRNGPPPSERDLVWRAMQAVAREAHFADALPGQFHQSFGKPIEQGTVEEWKQATDLMKQACG